jgi:hypothetical protein
MPRHPEQNAGLERFYKKRKATTQKAFMEAMDRLLRGESIYTNGKLTEANLCREAKRSRATLNRYQDIKNLFSEAKLNRNKRAPTNLTDKVRELEETIKLNQVEHNRELKEVTESRDSYAQETYILYQVVELLRREKADLEHRLRDALIGRKPRLVTHS